MTRQTGTIATRLLMALAILAALLGACQPQGGAAPEGELTSTPPPGSPPAEMPRAGANQVIVTLTEYDIGIPESIPAGVAAFEATNEGSIPHNLRVQGEGTDVSFPNDLQPGETAVLEVALEPGDYVVTCPIANHAQLGMRVEITVVPRS